MGGIRGISLLYLFIAGSGGGSIKQIIINYLFSFTGGVGV